MLERPINKRHQHILSSLSSSTFITFIKTSSLTATLIQTYFPSLVHQSYLSSEHPRSDQPHGSLSFAHHQHRLLNSFTGHFIIILFNTYFHSAVQLSYLSSGHPQTIQQHYKTSFPHQFLIFHEDSPTRSNSNSNLLSLSISSFIKHPSLKATTFLTFFPATVRHSYFVLGRPINKRHQHILSFFSSSTFITFIKTSYLQQH